MADKSIFNGTFLYILKQSADDTPHNFFGPLNAFPTTSTDLEGELLKEHPKTSKNQPETICLGFFN